MVFKKIKLYLWFRSKGLPQANILKESSLFKVNPRTGDPSKFREQMLKSTKVVREFIIKESSGETLPITKIAGEPWWPEGIERPKCENGHLMTFIAQILLSDVPLSDMPENALLSFHYCEECTEQGNMTWGWTDLENNGYNLTIFQDINQKQMDNLGIVATPLTKNYSVTFKEKNEVLGYEESANNDSLDLPNDYPQGKDNFDENIYPGLIHVHKSKIGGWPSWVQHPEWPTNDNGDEYLFLGQLDWMTFDGCPWCNGGYAYLFLDRNSDSELKAELLIQTT